MNIYCSPSSGRGSWCLRYIQSISQGKVFRGQRNSQDRSQGVLKVLLQTWLTEKETITYSPVCLASSQGPSPVNSWCTLAHISSLSVSKASACNEMPGFLLPLSNPLKWWITEDRGVPRPAVALQNPNQGLVASFPRLPSHCQGDLLCLPFPTSIKNGM